MKTKTKTAEASEVLTLLDLERPEFKAERKRLKTRGTTVTIWRQRKGVKIPWVETLAPVERISPTQFTRWLEYMMRDDESEVEA